MEIVVVIGSIILSFLVFTWLLKVVKATLKTAVMVALILLALQLFFGIGPEVIMEQIQTWLPGAESSYR
ncbi:hypothetical protein XM38_022690 [Halomicronema hongdechloris C2206]|uniref:Uncharacterized protein n=1 Tax=Halomicronema hongdechloris C2206 TaxID=1641165 RepID=A0A1Z3HMG6_9CYAN|nr:hypothetical protein [Halomicronema hongdechloris]ASC71317.1 hypothetical protein XM38_022690 [Halomicronema hongdechloris C2206]